MRQVSYYVRIFDSAFVDLEDSISAKAAGEFERNYRLEKPSCQIERRRLRRSTTARGGSSGVSYAQAKAVRIDPQASEHPDVILSPAPLLEGKVIDEHGRPVAGLRFDMMFYWHTTSPARGNRPQIIGFGGEHPQSGNDGSFKCPVAGFPSEDLDLEVQIRQPGFVAQTLAVSDMKTGLTLTVKRPAGRVEGQVLGLDGQPLRAFTVSAMYPGSGPSGDYRTDRKQIAARLCAYARFAQSEGRFSLEDLPEGELELAATADQAGKPITGRLRITVTKGVPNAPVVIRCTPGPDPTTLW